MWKFIMFLEWFAFYVLLLLALPPAVNSNETPTPTTLHTSSPTSSTASLGQCAVCLDKDCAIGVRIIYPASSDTAVWSKANSRTGIQTCSRENLKADAPCKMANGSLVQLANKMLHFEGMDAHDVRHTFKSQILPCADLNLPSSSTLSPAIKASIHNTPTPAAPNNSVADNKGIIIGSVIGIIIISIGFFIWK